MIKGKGKGKKAIFPFFSFIRVYTHTVAVVVVDDDSKLNASLGIFCWVEEHVPGNSERERERQR